MPSPSGERPGAGGRRGRFGRGSERGAGHLGCVLGLLLVVAIGYVMVIVVESEFRFRSVREAINQELRTSVAATQEGSLRQVREDIVERVEQLDLPSAAHQVTVRPLPGGEISVSLSYADTLVFLDRFTWIRPRRISVRHGG